MKRVSPLSAATQPAKRAAPDAIASGCMSALPDELLGAVLGWLDLRSFIASAAVSRLWAARVFDAAALSVLSVDGSHEVRFHLSPA
jgi:hypothetical protein